MTTRHHDDAPGARSGTPAAERATLASAGTAPPRTPPARLMPALWFLLAFTGLYLFAVWTPLGQRTENALIVGYADQARVFAWTRTVGLPPLTQEWATVATGLALIVTVALIRRCPREGCAAVAVAAVTLAVTEAVHALLPRPDLVGAPHNLLEPSFPSGHVAITAGLALGAVLVCPPRIRPFVAAAGTFWLAVTAAAVQALYWHRPSDVLGATLLACACHTVATDLLRPTAPRAVRRPRARLPLALAGLGALAAGAREDSLTRPLAFAVAALACSALLWATATRTSAPLARHRAK
jgi:membrane-associated phospholipid phosphatase